MHPDSHDPYNLQQGQFHFHLHSHPKLQSHLAPVPPPRPPTTTATVFPEALSSSLHHPISSSTLQPDPQPRWLHQSSDQTTSSASPPAHPVTGSDAIQPSTCDTVSSSSFYDPAHATSAAEYQQPLAWNSEFQFSFQNPSSQASQVHAVDREYQLGGYDSGEFQFVHVQGPNQNQVESHQKRTQKGSWHYEVQPDPQSRQVTVYSFMG